MHDAVARLERPRQHLVLRALGEALVRRKRVSFAYHAMATDAMARREVEPYGLFFLSGHWYLAGRDRERDALRNFRVSRIGEVEIDRAHAATPDYEVPGDFRLAEHARSRQAWELGDGDALEVVVQLTDAGLAAINGLGTPVAGEPMQRCFRVRRLDTFVRWMLSLALDARPVSPPSLAVEYERQLDAALALYAPRDEKVAP